jgi:hypothetical protein
MQKSTVSIVLVLGFACAGCDQTEAIRHYRVPKSLAADSPKVPKAAAPKAAAPKAAESPPVASQSAASKPSQNAGPQRMLAALVLQAERAWFFKAMGPEAPLGEHADAFRALVKSVRFADGKPQWNLPEGWRQKGESGMRFATLEFGSADSPLELTVIPLPIPPGDRSAYVLSNVNRWRQQVNLSPIAASELDQQSEKVDLDGATAVVVDLHGK